MRRASEKDGFVRAYTKGTDRCFQFAFGEWEPLLTAWEGGKTFFRGKDCYGDPQVVKLGEVVGLALATPESILVYDEEEADAKLKGED